MSAPDPAGAPAPTPAMAPTPDPAGTPGSAPQSRPAPDVPADRTGTGVPTSSVRAWGRLYRSELRLVFRRRRNLLLLVVTAVFPVVIGIALRLAAPHPQGGGNGPGVAFFNQLAGNGVFLAFIA